MANWNRIYPDELWRIAVPLLTPTIDDCRLLQALPKHHGDPFDRMLVCQAWFQLPSSAFQCSTSTPSRIPSAIF
jgi:PIN domain nuclease of toxin-antitoxin system